MPMYYYRCEVCHKEKRRICSPEDAGKAPMCCDQHMKRDPRACSARCVETLDNGLMTKKLERLTDAERLFHERAEATKKQQSGE